MSSPLAVLASALASAEKNWAPAVAMRWVDSLVAVPLNATEAALMNVSRFLIGALLVAVVVVFRVGQVARPHSVVVKDQDRRDFGST